MNSELNSKKVNPKFATCSVSFEHKTAITAFYELLKRGYNANLELKHTTRPKINIHAVESLREVYKALKEVGIPLKKLIKEAYLGQDGQYATGYNEDVRVSVFPKGNVFEGCKVVYREVDVPATPAHKETRAEIVCKDA